MQNELKSAMSPSGKDKKCFTLPKTLGKMSKICSEYVPPTTKKSTMWAVQECNAYSTDQCPLDLLEKSFHGSFESLATAVYSGG